LIIILIIILVKVGVVIKGIRDLSS